MRIGSRIALAVVAAVFAHGQAQAQAELFKMTASDAAAGDSFGDSVSISGGLIVVGASLDDDNGGESGSAYVFDVTTGQELFKLTASDGAGLDRFGGSVSISGNLAIVGAWGDDAESGSAYIFDVTTGQELRKLTASDGWLSDEFGRSVSISGARAILGARGDDDNGGGSGSAYIFDVTTGQELLKLTASDGAAGDWFGFSVSISGDRAIVGAWFDADNGYNSGSAYVFDVTTGQELFKLTASDGAAVDRFGYSVSISGARAVVGAYGDDGLANNSGSAYVFDVTTGQELLKLTASDPADNARLGFSVSMSGDRAILGADRDDDNGTWSGSAYVFDVTTGQELLKLTASDGAVADFFGSGVSISGDRAVVGVYGDDDNGADSGSAYVFETEVFASFCSGDGAATVCPCGNLGDPGEGCANSSGAAGVLFAIGSSSVADDGLTFTAAQLLPAQPALLFVGVNAINGGDGVPFGDGLRCAGGSVVRLGVQTPDANGDASWGPGLGATGGWAAGETRFFQAWYRDPAGPCGSSFNLSNGVEVTFTP